jgi:octaprenyl-diphosphate synthase
VTYAVGGRGKRLRPLVRYSRGATGEINSGHVDLAIIVELIHLATLVHDDIMDEAERRRASLPSMRLGNSLSVLLGDCLFAHALDLSTILKMQTSVVQLRGRRVKSVRENDPNAASF